jgi:hypothetical protein
MAASPGENFVLQLLKEVNQPNLVHMNVLDVAVAGVADTVALVEWAYSAGAAPVTHMAGFSVMRFDVAGNLMWQLSRTLCSFNNLECGKFEIEGHLARASNGFVVAGSGIKFDEPSRKPLMFALRIDDAGALLWARTYGSSVVRPEFGRVVSIAPMQVADHFLIAANTNFEEAWFFEIDGDGKLVSSAQVDNFHVTRLRALPTQGICALGAFYNAEGPFQHPGILNFDPTKIAARWVRYYSSAGGPPRQPGIDWLDIAEGSFSLLVVGQIKTTSPALEPILAYIETDASGTNAGAVRLAFLAALEGHTVRVRGVAGFVEEVVGVAAGGERKGHFAVCGEARQQPWQFLVDEVGLVHWQKTYRLPAGASGTLAPIRWPAFNNILAGGVVQSGGRPNGFLTSSPASPRPRDLKCSADSTVKVEAHVVNSRRWSVSLDALPLEVRDCFLDAGPPLRVKKECLDSQ